MAKLGNPQETIEVLQKHDFHFQKKFGQNFLIDPRVLEKIIQAADVTKDDFVLEIGPGIGTMTQYLCEAARQVLAVEIDHNLIPILKETLSGYDNVSVLQGDILKQDIPAIAREYNEGRPIKVVANLPYYITTPILMGAPVQRDGYGTGRGGRPHEGRAGNQGLRCPLFGGTVLCENDHCRPCATELFYAPAGSWKCRDHAELSGSHTGGGKK